MLTVQSVALDFSVTGCTAQHPGDRPEQQDRVAILRSRQSPRCVLGVLADGIGGKSGGALAAAQVTMVAERLFDEFQEGEPSEAFFDTLIAEAATVLSLSGLTSGLEPHSTLAAVLIQPERTDWCHVGDSRVYHLRDGEVRSRTRDHTVAQHLVDSGRSTPERARLHPSASLLTQALGGSGRPAGSFAGIRNPSGRDRFLICSDGLWTWFSDTELGAAMALPTDRAAAAGLIDEARRRALGRGDNCSLVLLSLGPR